MQHNSIVIFDSVQHAKHLMFIRKTFIFAAAYFHSDVHSSSVADIVSWQIDENSLSFCADLCRHNCRNCSRWPAKLLLRALQWVSSAVCLCVSVSCQLAVFLIRYRYTVVCRFTASNNFVHLLAKKTVGAYVLILY